MYFLISYKNTHFSSLFKIETLTFPRIILKYSPFFFGNACSISERSALRRVILCSSASTTSLHSGLRENLYLEKHQLSTKSISTIATNCCNVLAAAGYFSNALRLYRFFDYSNSISLMVQFFDTFWLQACNFLQLLDVLLVQRLQINIKIYTLHVQYQTYILFLITPLFPPELTVKFLNSCDKSSKSLTQLWTSISISMVKMMLGEVTPQSQGSDSHSFLLSCQFNPAIKQKPCTENLS